MAIILDGKALSNKIKSNLAKESQELFKKTGKKPCLAVVLVGEDPASEIYVGSKEQACFMCEIQSKAIKVPSLTQEELEKTVLQLNQDPSVNGILVQLPLPKELNEEAVIDLIDPQKDVDGFHPFNTGKLWINLKPYFFPCTPWGVYQIIKEYKIDLSGKDMVIVGRSNIVGKPLAGIFSQKLPFANATVTLCHSQTKDLEKKLKQADCIIAALGKPHFITGDHIKKGAVVIDVGINRVPDTSLPKGYKVVGDVDFESAIKKASYITPVPGGVGAMTIAMLLENTLKAFKLQNGLLEE